ncbi:trp operon leader peptide [Streptomyces antnestii]|uniref:Trp operon leader peptide n=1 Tax=Streptomyces antnestii TaxID=2494256 RepID=A0A3S2VYW9_9ACTN|nr:trp operon leader peptide [Streptomyces sp. San01]
MLPALALVLAFTVTSPTLRGRVGVPADRSPFETRRPQMSGPSGRVRHMFAHTTRNWWWTAPPAAH